MKQSGLDKGPHKLETCLRDSEALIKYNKRTEKPLKKDSKKKNPEKTIFPN